MTRAAALWCGAHNEARALLPTWGAGVAAVTAVAVLGDARFPTVWGEVAHIAASIALAAWAIGHEYTNRTLATVLSLPVDRRLVLLIKLGVVTPMLLTLGGLALAILPAGGELSEPTMLPRLSLLCALLLAPWLTMVCRSPLAGAIFAASVVSWVLFGANLAGLVTFGWSDAALAHRERLALTLRWWGLPIVCALAAAATWRTFMRLQVIDGQPDVHWPYRWRRGAVAVVAAPVARRRHPLWLLAKKELRLQQMTFAVAVVFVLMGNVASMLGTIVPELNGPLAPIAVIYGVMLAWVTGSLASAEERHLGTLEWQTLLPIAAWQQWMVKAGITLGLAVILGFGVPLLVATDELGFDGLHVGTIIILASASLYSSSLFASGLRTLTMSGPVILVVLLLLGWYLGHDGKELTATSRVALVALIALALRFAFENHRSAGLDVRRVSRQVAWMAATMLAAVLAQA